MTTAVFDNGSKYCRAGIAGDDNPQVVVPSIVGCPRHKSSMKGLTYQDTYVGFDAQARRGILELQYPVERGIIADWDTMAALWRHIYAQDLRIPSEDYSALLTETLLPPPGQRQKTFEVFFEDFGVRSLSLASQGVLSLYCSGRTTGLVVDVGDGACQVTPVSEGFVLRRNVARLDLAGRDLTHSLMQALCDKGHSFRTSTDREIAYDIKEQLCYVALSYVDETKKEIEFPFELPDGEVIRIGREVFCCPEGLFQPGLVGSDFSGVHECAFNVLLNCDVDLRNVFCENVLLAGGTARMKGFKDRMSRELEGLIGGSVKVSQGIEEHSTWIGASILGSLANYHYQFIQKEDYFEVGPSIALRPSI
uniref:Actin n=1 Tax=Arcella intermedia TaxID=1963864 RepID=A0A6B2L7P8_9EUKA